MKFSPVLCTKEKWSGGYESGAAVNMTKLADEAFDGKALDGPWLTCYMIRRFGWPNAGSDDHKDLCAWMLTTPVPGLFLAVRPYLGGPRNFHFVVCFNDAVGRELDRDPGRESCQRRRYRAIRAWWNKHGGKLYALGMGKKHGDEDELVHLYGEEGEDVGGLWRRPLKVDRPHEPLPDDSMVLWWLGEFIEKNHDVKLPTMTVRERENRETAFIRKCKAALKAAMVDLLRPIAVRDIGFNPAGRDERDIPRVERFSGAGYAPEEWFKMKRRRAVKP